MTSISASKLEGTLGLYIKSNGLLCQVSKSRPTALALLKTSLSITQSSPRACKRDATFQWFWEKNQLYNGQFGGLGPGGLGF